MTMTLIGTRQEWYSWTVIGLFDFAATCRRDYQDAVAGRRDECSIYRLYGLDDELLYVGITNCPFERWRTHASTKAWEREVDLVLLEWLPSRDAALVAEANAIEWEDPLFNLSPAARSYRLGGWRAQEQARRRLAQVDLQLEVEDDRSLDAERHYRSWVGEAIYYEAVK